MSEKLEGGCQCGELRYEVTGEPILKAFCHCDNCQKSSGGGHTFLLAFPDANLSFSGPTKEWSYTAESGEVATSGFCPECGSSVYGRTDALPGHTSLRAGTFDGECGFEPDMVVHARRRREWDRDRFDIEQFEKGPPDV